MTDTEQMSRFQAMQSHLDTLGDATLSDLKDDGTFEKVMLGAATGTRSLNHAQEYEAVVKGSYGLTMSIAKAAMDAAIAGLKRGEPRDEIVSRIGNEPGAMSAFVDVTVAHALKKGGPVMIVGLKSGGSHLTTAFLQGLNMAVREIEAAAEMHFGKQSMDRTQLE